MRKLTLYLSEISSKPGLIISELLVRNSRGKEVRSAIGDGGQFDDRSKTSIEGICFLIITTYLGQKARSGDTSQGFIHRTDSKYFPFLRSLFNSKAQQSSNWQEDLFGDNPYHPPEQFLQRRGSPTTGTAEPFLLSGVELEIKSSDKLLKIEDQNLADLAECLAAGVVSNPEKLTVSIKGNDFEIRSSNKLGSLSLNDRVRVLVNFNFRCHIYVHWITCKSKVVSLYPKSDLSVSPAKLTTDDKGQRILVIPEHEQMQVKETSGHEICLIFVSGISLNPQQLDLLKEKINGAVTDHDGSVQLDETDFREYSISRKKKKLLRRRLGEIESPKGWEADLVNGLKDLVQKAYFFYIPNRE